MGSPEAPTLARELGSIATGGGHGHGAAARWTSHAQRVIPGGYAWVATVATPAAGRDATALARTLGLAALVALLAGPFIAMERPRAGSAVGVGVFLALCVGAWLALGPLLAVGQLDPVRAALGGIGWACFALAWGNPRRSDLVPEDDPRAIAGDALTPRGTLPWGAGAVLAIGIVGALVPVAVAWRVDRTGHALLAHAAALLCALFVLRTATNVALDRGGGEALPSPEGRVHAARHALGAASLLLAIGGVIALAR